MYTVRIHFYAVRYESNYAGLFIIAGDIKYKKASVSRGNIKCRRYN